MMCSHGHHCNTSEQSVSADELLHHNTLTSWGIGVAVDIFGIMLNWEFGDTFRSPVWYFM